MKYICIDEFNSYGVGETLEEAFADYEDNVGTQKDPKHLKWYEIGKQIQVKTFLVIDETPKNRLPK